MMCLRASALLNKLGIVMFCKASVNSRMGPFMAQLCISIERVSPSRTSMRALKTAMESTTKKTYKKTGSSEQQDSSRTT
jgi:hypothetical protein